MDEELLQQLAALMQIRSAQNQTDPRQKLALQIMQMNNTQEQAELDRTIRMEMERARNANALEVAGMNQQGRSDAGMQDLWSMLLQSTGDSNQTNRLIANMPGGEGYQPAADAAIAQAAGQMQPMLSNVYEEPEDKWGQMFGMLKSQDPEAFNAADWNAINSRFEGGPPPPPPAPGMSGYEAGQGAADAVLNNTAYIPGTVDWFKGIGQTYNNYIGHPFAGFVERMFNLQPQPKTRN